VGIGRRQEGGLWIPLILKFDYFLLNI